MNWNTQQSLERSGSVPLYHQLRELLRQMIIEQRMPAHTRLPSESQLMIQFDASRITVRGAMNDLEKEGVIYKLQGKGSFVAPPRISRRFMSMISFTEEIRDKGLEPSSHILEADLKPAGSDVAAKLGIAETDLVYVIRRIRYADKRPVGLNTSHLNARLCPGFLEQADVGQGGLYHWVQQLYGQRIVKADRQLESIVCGTELAKTLDVHIGDPVLFLSGVVYVESGEALDFCIEYYREDC